ncbi:GNAT family N-acetyltransferase [Ningiella sp. W23]|uniref:GNAT family N-acetyltransferase n=1 Tax=Ningiella sp. W23 TaxID=3023715 RepID=UPI00375665D6
MSNQTIKVEIQREFNLDILARQWQTLEQVSTHRFFLSWHWISAWLKTFPISPILIRAFKGEQTLGLGFLCEKSFRRNRFFSIKQILLNEAGIGNYDQQWIEYNDFLVHDSFRDDTLSTMLNAIHNELNWNEFALGVSDSATVMKWQKVLGLQPYVTWKTRAHHLDLSALRHSQNDYLASLSKNSRSQIRRSINFYKKRGDLRIKHASTVNDALAMFDKIAPLHIERWGEGYQESGFANPHFVNFHKLIIRESFESGNVDVIQVSVNEDAIAYFYNFIYQQRVYFYLSALQYESDNKAKPGLVGHALCIQEYLDNGMQSYDFMGGGEKYKDSLSTCHDQFYRVSFQRPTVALKLESSLRKLKNRIKNHQSLSFDAPESD